ncbi:MAG TPA: hypothetical protein VFW78_03520 [Bacteroidia bacterium]|nr:hypothetical protein [Bacteroidia bacterium]
MNNVIPIVIAFHPSTSRFIHIDEASNGLSCNCVCIQCNEKLEAIQGNKRKRHFRHHVNTNCVGAKETALHELGKQILVENNRINIRNHGIITYSNAIAEKRLEKYRPDVTAFYEGQPIYFEIFVSHAVDKEKAKFFSDNKIKSLEIDLSKSLTANFDEIKQMVLEKTQLQTVFYWEDISELPLIDRKYDVRFFESLILFLVILLAFIGILKLMKNKNKLNYTFIAKSSYQKLKNKPYGLRKTYYN